MALHSPIARGFNAGAEIMRTVIEGVESHGGNDDDVRRLLGTEGDRLKRQVGSLLTEKMPFLLFHANNLSFPTRCNMTRDEVELADDAKRPGVLEELRQQHVPFSMKKILNFHLFCLQVPAGSVEERGLAKVRFKLIELLGGQQDNWKVGYRLASLAEAILFRSNWSHVVRQCESVYIMTHKGFYGMRAQSLIPYETFVAEPAEEYRFLTVDKAEWIEKP
jgi:hypothetical protein